MYPQPSMLVEIHRIRSGPLATPTEYGNNGYFELDCPLTGAHLLVAVSDGLGWEHVSVSIRGVFQRPKQERRCPRWEEMCWVKDQFWPKDQVVVQFHPAETDYRNYHHWVLHLWRPTEGPGIPTPPPAMVAPKGWEIDEDQLVPVRKGGPTPTRR